jgi:hypothetical protein
MRFPNISELWHTQRRNRAALVLSLTALTGLAYASAPASAAAAAQPASSHATAGVVSSDAKLSGQAAASVKGAGVSAQERALAAYWTPARMKAALPESELPAVKHAAASKPAAGTASKPQGPAGQVAPATAKVAHPATITPQGYGSYASPLATVGKVYFSLNGGNYQCSASVVNSEGKSTVWTAGHCVTGSGAWASNWVFVPACYGNGAGGCVAPYGYWYAKQLWTTSAYFGNNNSLANDVGAVVMWPNSGYEIVNYLGGQGIQWNFGLPIYVCAFGYPVPGYTGVDLVEACDYAYDYGDGTDYMFNNMTGGSSGGPWLASFNGAYGYIVGHNDFRYNVYPNYMWSPYYGNQVASLYGSVRYLVG